MLFERFRFHGWLLFCLIVSGAVHAERSISVDDLSRRSVLKFQECVRLLVPGQQQFGNVEGDIACYCDFSVAPQNRRCNLHTLRAMGMPVYDKPIDLPFGEAGRAEIADLAGDLHLLMVDVRTSPWRRQVLSCRASVGITLYSYHNSYRSGVGFHRDTFLLCPSFDPANIVLPDVYDDQLKIVGQVLRHMRNKEWMSEAAFPADLGNLDGIEPGAILPAALYPTRAVVRELRERTGLPLFRLSERPINGRMVCCSDGIDAEVNYAVPDFAGGGTVSAAVTDGWINWMSVSGARGEFEVFETRESDLKALESLQSLLQERLTYTNLEKFPELSYETLFSGKPCPGLLGLCGVQDERSLDVRLWYDATGHHSAYPIGILKGPRVLHQGVKGVLVGGDLCGTDRVTVTAEECFSASAMERLGRFWFVPLSAADDDAGVRHAFSMDTSAELPRRSLAVARPGGSDKGGMLTADSSHYRFLHCLGVIRERQQFAICAEPVLSDGPGTVQLREELRVSGTDGHDKLGLFRVREDLLLASRTDTAELVGTLRPKFKFMLALPQGRVANVVLMEVEPLNANQSDTSSWENSDNAWIKALIRKAEALVTHQDLRSVLFEPDELARLFDTSADSADFKWLLSALDAGFIR